MLTAREEEVLSLRFGLDGEGFKTLEQVGRRLGVTRERIRQVEAKALNKIPNNSESILNILEDIKEKNKWRTSAYTIG
tara:strand:+ start:284 stop:517 length:234 start_codon:yes stop_codon:yes gene_type:complete